jgi:hypothetical protein
MPQAKTESTIRRAVVAFRDEPVAHPYDRLPFVTAPVAGKTRNFWAPRATGDYTFDCSLGAQYADAVIPMLRTDHILLGMITLGILEHGDNDNERGVIVGFMGQLSKKLIVGPARQLRAVCDLAALPV